VVPLTVWTKGFEELRKGSLEVRMAAAAAGLALAARGHISWVVAKPDAVDLSLEDEGRTLALRCPIAFWAIRDYHDADCTCGCGGRDVVTYMLPGEY